MSIVVVVGCIIIQHLELGNILWCADLIWLGSEVESMLVGCMDTALEEGQFHMVWRIWLLHQVGAVTLEEVQYDWIIHTHSDSDFICIM
jgi:hypothetical protein